MSLAQPSMRTARGGDAAVLLKMYFQFEVKIMRESGRGTDSPPFIRSSVD
ncbi:MAG: hypothetical protein LBB47_06360 [Spirochaetaceae bacterium]|nr:hypothetical protein [Spirochaetaceae bacterium]